MSLRERMAEYGFETNEDYALPLRLLLERPTDTVRMLNITGEPGRSRTAFASALANALEFPQVLYHDFTQADAPPPSADEDKARNPPIDPFDRVMSEACALSEGERCIVILDQLHRAPFAEHLRLYEFLKSGEWYYLDTYAKASIGALILFVISEEPLYHSLQKLSLKVWVDASSGGRPAFKPADFGRDRRIGQAMERLGDLFELLGVVPTHSEYARILYDIDHFIRTPDGLIKSIYGWTNGVGIDRFKAPPVIDRVNAAIDAIHQYIGLEEVAVVPPADGETAAD